MVSFLSGVEARLSGENVQDKQGHAGNSLVVS